MIDVKIQEQLRQKYNPDGSPLRQHQLKLLEMLKYLDKVCTENGIRYWLSSGTCLGAVRHGGFIPWDDDVDVEMMREDYLKLEKVFKETDDYVIQTWKNDRYYSTSFAKLRDKHTVVYDSLYMYRGVFIDLFALEYTSRPISFICSYLHKFFSGRLYDFLKAAQQKGTYVMRLLFHIGTVLFLMLKYGYFISVPLFRLIGKIWYNRQLRHNYGVGWINNTRCEKNLFPLRRISFEGIMLPVPGDYDSYLSRIYGDYMKLPNRIPVSHAQYYKKI